MPIKQTAKRYDFEYESPDGDALHVCYVKNEGREYVELQRQGEKGLIGEKQVFDLEAFFEIHDELRKVARKVQPETSRHRSMPAPQVTDHRADSITSQVADVMENLDPNVEPIESFTPQPEDFREGRTGVDDDTLMQYGLEGVGETPSDLALDDEENQSQWKKDAKSRGKSRTDTPNEKKIKKLDDGRRKGAETYI